jgi:hypothetical protein
MRLNRARSPNRDVSNTVDVTSTRQVYREIRILLQHHFPDLPTAPLKRAFHDFDRLYRGEYPGFYACDTSYHDTQHVLDVTLAMARLIDGYQLRHGAKKGLGSDMALLGTLVALFHDAGYIRRRGDTRHSHGAEYTRVHVSRSARFLREYLPRIGLGHMARLAADLVHFTGYERAPQDIVLASRDQIVVGHLVGTADVIAQMADVAYLEKCRDRLYPEFEIGGIARQRGADGAEQVIYESARDLLEKTPTFVERVVQQRLDGCFSSVYRFAGDHFGGANLYMDAVHANQRRLQSALSDGSGSAADQRLLHAV